MGSQKVSPKQQTHKLTYFVPLKDENRPSSSNVLQMVYKFFSRKQGLRDEEMQKSIADGRINDGSNFPRPTVLDLATHKQGNKRKLTAQNSNHDPGSEVELRLRSLSSMLRDFPKLMKGAQPNTDQGETNSLSNNTSPNPSTTELRQYWMPDEQCHECYECGERFTTFRRRHHCRICGQIFCSRCCNQLISGEFMGYSGMLRSCTYCCKWVLTFAQGNATKMPSSNAPTSPGFEINADDSSRDLSTSNDSVLGHLNNATISGNGVGVLRSSSSSSLRRHSQTSGKNRHDAALTDESQYFVPGIPGPNSVLSPARDLFGRKPPNYIFDETPDIVGPVVSHEDEKTDLVKDSAQLHVLWRKINDEKQGIEFRDHRLRLRKYSSCITGQELVDWLIRNDITETRVQACAIGQALYDGKWLKSVTDIGGVFQDGYVLFQAVKKPTPNVEGTKIEIFPDHFANFSGDEGDSDSIYTLTDQEPIWVQEIKCEHEKEVEKEEEFYDAAPTSDLTWTDGHQTFDDSLIFSDDDRSVSERSIPSLSSFVEIDEDNDIIKYTRHTGLNSSYPAGYSRAVYSPQPGFEDSCLTSISADYLRSFLTWHTNFLNQPWIAPSKGWREADMQSAFVPSCGKRAYQWLRESYMHHNLSFLKQMLHDKDLDPDWAEILVPLAKHAVESVSPNPDVNIDVCHYVQIKKLLDGPRMESQLLNGVVCTKNVVHKHMRTDISDPAILLLAIPLEYQRVQSKLSTLDPIVRQEREFYKHLISRITARHPQVVLVQCTASHIAQKLLLDAGITLIINVKPSVMERVARCTEADIVFSIDQLLQAKLGTCSRFYIKHHMISRAESCRSKVNEFYSTNVKTLMYFDGCKPIYGCTILLRGGTECTLDYRQTTYELTEVQEVLRFLLQAMYHARLEISYLLDQQEFGKLLKKRNDVKHLKTPKGENIPVFSTSSENGFDQSAAPAEFDAEESRVNQDALDPGTPPTEPIVFSTEDSASSEFNDTPTWSPRKKEPVLKSLAPPSVENFDGSPNIFSNCTAFKKALATTLLTTSPLVRPKIPFLFTSIGLQSTMHYYLPENLFKSRKMASPRCTETSSIGTDQTRDRIGFRSRSSTMESLVQEKPWLTPPHHRTNGSTDHDGSTLSLETLSNSISSRDNQEDSTSTPAIRRDPSEHPTSCYSQHYKYHRRDVAPNSVSNMPGTNSNLKLNSWEQKLMEKVFRNLGSPINKQEILISVSSTASVTADTQITSGTSKCGQQHVVSCDQKNLSPINVMEANKQNRFEEMSEKRAIASVQHPFVAQPLAQAASSHEIRNLLASYRANAGAGNAMEERKRVLRPEIEVTHEYMKTEDVVIQEEGEEEKYFPFHGLESTLSPDHSPPDCLDPANHQHIHVLFSSHSTQSPNAPYPCVLPWVVNIDFYRGNDITLGGFLERYCFRPSYHCPNATCRRPMVEHVRSFVHGTMCLTIVLKELSQPFKQSSILAWNWDHVSKKSSDIKTMSHDVWSMSFAKYLELRLEDLDIGGTRWTHSPSEKPPFNSKDMELDQFTSFQYFLHRDIVAAFKCFPVKINEVVFPSSTLKNPQYGDGSFHTCQLSKENMQESRSISYYTSTIKTLSEKAYEVLDTILDCVNTSRTNRSSGTSDPPSEESQLVRDQYFEGLLAELNEERSHLREDIDSIQLVLQSLHISASVGKDLHKCNNTEDLDNQDTTDEEKEMQNNFDLSEQMTRNLSLRFLRLKCEISQLVLAWNNKLEETHEKDRAGNWESNGESPLPSRKAMHIAPVSIPEENDFVLASEELDHASSETEYVGASKEIQEKATSSDLDKALVTSRQSFSRKPRTSFSAESRNSEKSSSYKRMSRTGSSVRLLVTRLLPGNTLIPSIPLPFPADEHYLLPECVAANVVVRDAEPASIIAYALSSEEYRRLSMRIRVESLDVEHKTDGLDIQMSLSNDQMPLSSQASTHSVASSHLSKSSDSHASSENLRNDLLKSLEKNTTDTSVISLSSRSSLIPPTPTSTPHIELQFSDSTTKFYCKVYFASLFEKLRSKILVGGEVQYLASLSRSVRWVARGGKSGSTFHKTRDDQFIMKQMSYFELQSFLEFAPKYVNYISSSMDNQETTTLSKILGLYRVSFRNSESNRSMKQDVIVIENLFYQKKIGQIFDLKGSVRNRNVKVDGSTPPHDNCCNAEHNDVVLLDENLLKLMCDNPLYVHEHAKHLLKSAIERDTNFLSGHLIMDYSLLAGVDEKNEIIVGIIDYIRTFTWDKKLEMVVKSYGMFGGRKQSNRTMPTVVSPELYKNRFCDAMDRYFQVVPDRWYGMHAY